ncbi:MAG: hypothetical protein K4H23_03570 [Mollicutes bacterium PWAP]|nr:hypothetical protein [Mollicutes bacterium PWAP]
MNLLIKNDLWQINIFENIIINEKKQTFSIASKTIKFGDKNKLKQSLTELPKENKLKINNFSIVIDDNINGIELSTNKKNFSNNKELKTFVDNNQNETVFQTVIKKEKKEKDVLAYIKKISINNEDISELIRFISNLKNLKIETILLLNETLNMTYASKGALQEGVAVLKLDLNFSTLSVIQNSITVSKINLNFTIGNLLQKLKTKFNLTEKEADILFNNYNEENLNEILFNKFKIRQGIVSIKTFDVKNLFNDFKSKIVNAINIEMKKFNQKINNIILIGKVTKINSFNILDNINNFIAKKSNKNREIENMGIGINELTKHSISELVNISQTQKLELGKFSLFNKFQSFFGIKKRRTTHGIK